VFKCQAVDRNDNSERAAMLVDILSRHRDDASLSAFFDCLSAVGQQPVVDEYFTDVGKAPGRHHTVL